VYCEDNVNPDPQAITYDIIKSFEVGSELMSKGMPGEIISAEPIQKDNYNWWHVRYDDGTVGWSFENGLDSALDNSEIESVTEASSNKFNKGDRIETNRNLYVRSEPGKKSAIETPNAYAGYNNYDNGIVSYGRIQFIAKGGTGSPLYRLLESYTTQSQSETSKQLKTYVDGAKDGTKPWGEPLRNDKTFHDLLMKAASEETMQTAQDELFKKDYYDKAKAKATEDKVTSALGIAIYCDAAVNRGLGKLNTLRASTQEYFDDLKKRDPTAEPPKEQERLKKFLDVREKDLKDTGWPITRVDALRKLVVDGNLDLKQGDSKYQIDLGQYGKIYTIDAPTRLEQGTTPVTADVPKTPAQELLQDATSSNIVGEWNLHSRRASEFTPTDSTITIYSDHTLHDSSYGTGTWSQNGKTIRWEYDTCGDVCTRFKTTYDGTIDRDMKGTMQTCDGEEGDWSADRRYTDPGIMA
jgi:hypothetical protein